jgi:hypothetical protein
MRPLPDSLSNLQYAPGITLSKAVIHAAAMDAAKRNMRRQGRTVLNEDDVACFQSCFDSLFELTGGPSGWFDLPPE